MLTTYRIQEFQIIERLHWAITNYAVLKVCNPTRFGKVFTKLEEGTSSQDFKIPLQGFLVLQLVKDRGARIYTYNNNKKAVY